MTRDFYEPGDANSSGGWQWAHSGIVLTSIALLIVCGIVLPPLVNANRFRARLSRELGSALGRPVQMENVSLRLLPRPGFDFENFEVSAEPQFGAEPVVRAAKVTVYIRLLPLWRGHIEVATISLQDASLNIARNPQGQWNFAGLLQRTAQLPAQTPTGQRHGDAGTPFPYLEVANGRINFKRGEEKLPFSFTNADFSLWLAQPGEWRLRFRATPVRTDLDAAYAGDLRLEGSIHRGTAGPRSAQLTFEGSWRHAPLRQLARVLLSEDRGWRGESSVDFALSGTSANSAVQARATIDGLRREDFVPVANLPVAADCTANLQLLTQTLTNATCNAAAGAGRLTLSAPSLALKLDAPPATRAFAVALDHVPAEWLLASLRLVRQGLSTDLAADGDVSGQFAYDANDKDAASHLSGQATWQHGVLRVASSQLPPLQLPDATLAAGELPAQPTGPARLGTRHSRLNDKRAKSSPAPLADATVHLLPLALPLGGNSPLQVSGSMGRTGYNLSLNGNAQLQRVAPLLRALGFARWAVLRRISGAASAEIQVQDAWKRSSATPPAQVQGTIILHNVSVDTAWLPGTISLSQGKVSLGATGTAWQALDWTWAGAKFDGAATRINSCADAASCAWHISAHAPALNLQQVVSVFRPSAADQLFSLFGSDANPGWPPFQIDLNADTLTAGRLNVAHFSAGIAAAGATLNITRCSGTTLGSEMECFGKIEMGHGAAQLSIAASRANLAAAGALFKETWGTGMAETSVDLKLQNGSPSGTFTAMLHNAEFSGAAAASPLARVQSWQMSGQILSDHLQIDRSLLTSGGHDMPVTGSVGFDRRLSLDINVAGAAPKHVGGTVAAPRMQ